MTNMTNAETSALVFKDQAGGYFVLPLETMERGRVPVEHTAEVERLIAEQADTQGYFLPAFLGLIILGEAIAIGIGFTGPQVEPVRRR